MILVDSSVWIDHLRGLDTLAARELRRLIREQSDELVMCEPIAMELLAGTTDARVLDQIERLVDGLPTLSVEAALDFRTAAALYRAARRSGRTVRSLNDCLIAAVAIRGGVLLVHKDVDFEVLGDISTLNGRSWR